MPDFAESTAVRLATAQSTLLGITARLRQIDLDLALLTRHLAQPHHSLVRDEIRGVVGCVRSDLLADAIVTLEQLGRLNAEQIIMRKLVAADLLHRLPGRS